MVLVPTDPVRTASEFLRAFAQYDAFRFDTPAEQSEELLEITASMTDWIKDLDDIWNDCEMSERLQYARSFAELCSQLEALGGALRGSRHSNTEASDREFELSNVNAWGAKRD
jgi:hypothetical protein